MEKHKARRNEHIKFSSWFASKFPKFQKWKFPQAAKCRQLTTEPIAYDDVKSILKKIILKSMPKTITDENRKKTNSKWKFQKTYAMR